MRYNNGIGMEETKEKKPNSKATKVLLIGIVLVFILIVAIILTILYVQNGTLKVYIDGQYVSLDKDTIVVEESGKVYIAIKDIAKSLGYDAHNGEYKLYSEDTNKCYVDCKEETASFFLNSNKISKAAPQQTNDYEDYTIEEPVIQKNGKLYCSAEGIQVGFNVSFDYSKEKNQIQIYTLPYLVSLYNTTIKGYGYEGINKDFNNQKAILYNLFVINKAGGLYGVVTKDNKEIISPKYKQMQFNENAREFYVTDTMEKVGIVTETGRTKINILYDEITRVNKNSGLYAVRSSGKYGVLSEKGQIVIHLEYDQIGVDPTLFPNNNINNRYLLFDNVIPVCRDKKWGLFDKTGKELVGLEIDAVGYAAGSKGNSSGKIVNNLLLIPSYKAIVLGKSYKNENKEEKRYALYDDQGNQIVPFALQSIYSVTSAGADTYHMEYNGTTMNVEEYIAKLYELQGKTKPTDTVQDGNTVTNKIQ